MRRAVVAMMLVAMGSSAIVASSTAISSASAQQPASKNRRPRKHAEPARPSRALPLHDWMEEQLVPAVEAGDTARIATLYEQLARFAPSAEWNQGERSWQAISEAGAGKAREGDLRGARAACKQCHSEWKERYRAEFRGRALPR